MKHEIYSCLKMLEAFHDRVIKTYNLGVIGSYYYLGKEYQRLWELLKKHLTQEQIQFIPQIETEYISEFETDKRRVFVLELSTICSVAISYLHSLDMDIDKELSIKKEELKLKEKELEAREKEIDFMNKLLNKSLDAIKQFPELQRSKIVEGIKKSHRQIEEHSKNQ
ncbi:hypothetical protein HYU50_04060 [Candidatus Woesearchaeota archaeon]|nr:hypothetical protein [Candidatus Woesearchaeota archaeon]